MENYTDQYVNFAQQKVNGLNITIYRNNLGQLKITTRVKYKDITKELTNNPTTKDILNNIPNNCRIVCELTTPEQIETDVVHHLKQNKPLQLWFLFFHSYEGFEAHELSMHHCIDIARKIDLLIPETIFFPKPQKINPKEWNQKAQEKNYEGWVFKVHHGYGHYKLKPINTVDAFVIRTTASESTSFYGGLGSIEIGVFDPFGEQISLGKVGSGFTKEFRMNCVHSSLIGKVAEIAYDLISRDNKLKRPRFVRWRADKLPSECNLDQLNTSQ